jgi:hypothetical protein
VERRRESRFSVDAAVTVTVLGGLKQPPMIGRAVSMSGSGLKLVLPLPIPCGAAVKVEGDNLLVLGEVCRAEFMRDAYDVGLKVSHTLGSLAELERLTRALLGERKVRV